jgi:hypothetical protein
MAFNFSPGGVYNPRPLDFSALADLPEDFWKGQDRAALGTARAEVSEALKKGDYQGAAAALAKLDPTKAYAQATGYDSGASVYGTPIWGQRDGKDVVGVVPKNGGTVQWLDSGDTQPRRGLDITDFGYGVGGIDKGSGQPVGPITPKTGTLPPGYVPPPGYAPFGQPPASGVAPATQPGELDVQSTPVQPPQDRSAGAPATLPQGYATSQTPPPQEAGAYMPGTEQARTEAEAARKRRTEDTQRAISGDIITEDVDRAIELIDSDPLVPATGLGGQITQNVGGTTAHNLQQVLDGVRSSLTLERLQQVRLASPTGAALGNMSNLDLTTVQAAWGSVMQSQDGGQLKYNLRRFKNVYNAIVLNHGAGTKIGNTSDGPSRTPAENDPLGMR